jgi:hypothetical protein
MATEAHGKHGIFTDNFCVFRVFPWHLVVIHKEINSPQSRKAAKPQSRKAAKPQRAQSV